MTRTILHADCNAFYASCEMCYHPELKGRAVAVCGDPDARHGIVLAKSELAKKAGVKTAQPIWEAKQLCRDLILLPANFKLYLRFSNLVRDIFSNFTDRVESFGLDECWLDVSGDGFAGGVRAADEIRARMRTELGITASIGVADNKIMAKLGSDMKKPDATTLVSPDTYARKVYPLPVGELLYVGAATQSRLNRVGIMTIGDLAACPLPVITSLLGKNGELIWRFARGQDDSPVRPAVHDDGAGKSIGNSTTTPRDLVCEQDVLMTVMLLSESVAERMRAQGVRGRTVQLWVRDKGLSSFERQLRLRRPTQLAAEICDTAMGLFRANYAIGKDAPVRALGVRCADLLPAETHVQLSFMPEDILREKRESIERAVDGIRRRYGPFSIRRGMMLEDTRLTNLSPKDEQQAVVFYHMSPQIGQRAH